MKNKHLHVLIEGTLVAAICMVLSLIPLQGPNATFDVALGMIPLIVFGLRRGFKPAILAGFIWGLLKILSGTATIISIPQGIFEYPFAFTFGGVGGILHDTFQKNTAQSGNKKSGYLLITFSAAIAIFARWFWHFVAGVLVWGSYAPDSMNKYVYSLFINASSALLTFGACIIALCILYSLQPKLFLDPDLAIIKTTDAKD